MSIDLDAVQLKLSEGKSLRSIALSMGVTYQTPQYYRRRAGHALLRESSTRGESHASWRGGSTVDRYGYRMVLAPERGKASKYVMEHVLVAEKMLGRQMRNGEVVHHIDGDKLNNVPSNLHVCSRAEHKRLHAELEKIAYEFVRAGLVKWDGGYKKAG